MKIYEHIKIDTSFPEWQTKKLGDMLSDGWIVFDKTVVSDRYLFYVLEFETDEDLGKSGEQIPMKGSYPEPIINLSEQQ